MERADLAQDADAIEQLRAKGFVTVIRLPFRPGVERATVEADLERNLQARLLLFLPHIDHLELRGTKGYFSAEVARDSSDGVEQVLLDTNGSTEEWLIYRGAVVPEAEVLMPLGDTWKELEQVRFAVAVPLDESGEPRIGETFALHAYFPTDEMPGLHLAVHAEWMLSMDRRQIATTPEAAQFNRMLMRAIAHHLGSVVAPDLVRRTGTSTHAVEALVPALGLPTGSGAISLRRLWAETLQDTPFLPCVDGSLRRPTDIRLLPGSIPDPTVAHQLAEIDPAQTLRPDVELLKAVRTFLTVDSASDEMSLGEFVMILREPDRATASSHYAFLIKWRERAGALLVNELKENATVLVNGARLLTPGTDTIFFPRERGDVAMPDDLPVPIAYLPDIEGIRTLLRDLGVRPFEWRDLIRDFLVKILGDQGADPDERERAMAGLRAYHRMRMSGNEDLEPSLGRVLLPARSADGLIHELRPASEVYFSLPWTGSSELEAIYGPFGEAEFLSIDPPEDSDSRQDDLDFYRMLGVVDHPRLDAAKPSEPYGYMVYNLSRHPHRGRLFSLWLAQVDVASTAGNCPQHHPQSQQLRLSFRLDRHEQLIESNDPARLMALWNQLAHRWGSVYEEGMRAQFYCTNTSHAGEKQRTAPSLFAYALESQSWVPVDRGNRPELVRPSEAWIDATQTPRRIQERIPRISEAMYHAHGGVGLASALHLTDAGRPRVCDLLGLLASVADEADTAGSTNREIDMAARWVQRTLHDVLPDDADPHPHPESVRLLASMGGTTQFVSQPPFADDPLLRDTFETQRPLLSADTGLTRLTRFLALARLDDFVRTSPIPFGENRGEVFNAVHRRIEDIKPYLLALVRVENSSADGRVSRALRTLDIVVCEELVLTYEYDGTQVSRADAVCYIANRQERRGRRPINVGTAYLELDARTGEPHWFPLGRQLAQHLNVPTLADAFTMLLTALPDDRQRMMTDRHIQPHDIADARRQLRRADEDDDTYANVLDSLLLVASPVDEDESVAGLEAVQPNQMVLQITVSNEGMGMAYGGDASGEPATSVDPARDMPLPVNFAAVKIVDGLPIASSGPDPAVRPTHGGAGGVSRAPTIQTEAENRRIGKRGEEVAYHAERLRVKALGKNPDSVHWVSRTNELSPFDITSVDEDDQLIYIEVKSTKSDNPTSPFYISHSELIEASFRRSRFYIYRVTEVDAEIPSVTRWGDPIRLVKEGKGRLLLANAQMSLTSDDKSGTH